MLALKNITKTYKTPSNADLAVLQEINLDVNRGDSVSIVGPSGSGKSTLLNIIGALDKPTSGSVELDGKNVVALSDDELATMRNQEIGFVFQLHHLLPQLTVLENVLIPTLPLKSQNSADRKSTRLNSSHYS